MTPYYIWTLRLWCFDVKWKSKGFWKMHLRFLSRKVYVGKYQFRFFKHR